MAGKGPQQMTLKAPAELKLARHVSEATAHIQAGFAMAVARPRDEDIAFEKFMKSCKRPKFAEDAAYRFTRGKGEKQVDIIGPSVRFAREFARCWLHVQSGIVILRDDDKFRTIEGWAWDLGTNRRVAYEAHFEEAHFEKVVKRASGYITADERNLRELTNRHGAICVRNALLEMFPDDMIDEAMEQCERSRKQKATVDIETSRANTIKAFAGLDVTEEQLGDYLGNPMSEALPDQIVALREVFVSIRDGNSSVAEYFSGGGQAAATPSRTGKLNVDELEQQRRQQPTDQADPPAEQQGDDQDPYISQEQISELMTLAKESETSDEKLLKILNQYGADSTESIRESQLEGIRNKLILG